MAPPATMHSATAQFFINVVDNKRLDYVSVDQNSLTWGTACSKVVEGLDTVVQRSRRFPTDARDRFPAMCLRRRW